jgi:hypothetical protein
MALSSVQHLDCRSLSRRDGASPVCGQANGVSVSTTTATKKKTPT